MARSGDVTDAQSTIPPERSDAATLPRVLGLFDAVAIVVGSIIGSGIFLKTGNVAKELQSFGPIIGVWIVIGLVTLCGSLALAELAAMLPRAGGPYVYLREAYGRFPAFLWGWTEFWVIRTGSLGALSCASAIYLAQAIPMSPLGQPVVAISIVIGLSIINYYSTIWGAHVQNVTAVIKVTFLAAILVLPLLFRQTHVSNLSPIWPDSTGFDFLKGLGAAVLAVLWPYDGWINIAPVAEEIREPQRNLPRGLGLGMLVVIVVYAAANISYHLVLPMERVAGSQAIASDVFEVLFGSTGARIAALGVMCSTFGAVNSNMLTGPRIYFAMARDGLLPATLHRVHRTYQTPGNAIIIQGIWTTILLLIFYWWKDEPKKAFDGLTDSVILAGLIFYGLTVAAVYVLRQTRPDAERPYRTWGYPVTPALMLLVYAAVFVNTLVTQWQESAAVLVLIASGSLYYAWAARKRGPGRQGAG